MGTILLTGAGGVVGQALAPFLEQAGFAVRRSTHQPAGTPGSLDVTDRTALDRAFDGLGPDDAIVHLAAIAHRRRGVTQAEYDHVNDHGVRNVLEAARAAGAGRTILFSSAEVYGAQRSADPIPEDAPLHPQGPYPRSKAAGDLQVIRALDAGQDCVLFRFPVIYSPQWLVAVRRRVYLPASGGRAFMRILGRQPAYSMCGLPCAADAVAFALHRRLPPGVYNVADDHVYSHEDLRAAIAAYDGARPVIPVPNLLGIDALRTAALPARVHPDAWDLLLKLLIGYVLDTERIRGYGWRSPTGMSEILAPETA